MTTINDYKAWFDEVDLESSEYEAASNLVHVLRQAVYSNSDNDCGGFKAQIANGQNNGWIISADGVDDKLHLTTHKQISAFIRHIEASMCEDMDAEIYASYRHAMERDD